MSVHLQRTLDQLKQKVLELGTLAEESLRDAVKALEERNAELAGRVIDDDAAIDDMEVDIEEECLKILALYQPVAIDLRFIIAVLKINNDLERIGDIAVNIAERAMYLATQRLVEVNFDFHLMAQKAQNMLKKALDALVNVDPALARQVLIDDDEVDAMNRDVYIQVQKAIRRDIDDLEPLITLLSISRHLERVADQATNVAEDVIYMAQGEIVRHRIEEYTSRP
ncbi:MAG: phosphate signaling complex protein PhoU [Candidatus Hydrogenedentes bacterium]|nr:phosphate signaling complex protein PhoU [Candidatus Hydrogenedentota bacterium]MBI3118315.1 phosphate signaling complex protein PhoU [Candidatus Hydrogenedentota bacterium]